MSIIKGREGTLFMWNGAVTAMTDELTTEAGATAQITDTAKRMISPNHTQTWTDSGGKVVIHTDFLNGIATFNGNVGTVTVTGSYIPAANIVEIGQIYGWKLDINIDIRDATCLGDSAKVKVAAGSVVVSASHTTPPLPMAVEYTISASGVAAVHLLVCTLDSNLA